MPGRDIVVVGTSAGGVEALRALVGGLPADFPGSVFVVMPAERFMQKAREAERRSRLVRQAVFDHEHLSEEKVAGAADAV